MKISFPEVPAGGEFVARGYVWRKHTLRQAYPTVPSRLPKSDGSHPDAQDFEPDEIVDFLVEEQTSGQWLARDTDIWIAVESWCNRVADLAADALVTAGITKEMDKASSIISEEIFARLALRDFPPNVDENNNG